MNPKASKIIEKILIIVLILVVIGGITAIIIFLSKKHKSNWIEEADKSVLFVSCYDKDGELYCTGSGFLLYDDKTVVTNYHVVDGVSSVKVYTNQNVEYTVENIRNHSKDKDIAILSLSENTGLTPLTPGDSKIINKGEEVIAIGSPEGLQNSVSNGVLSTRTEGFLQITAPISHGSSGGALFNKNGEVIGVTRCYISICGNPGKQVI
jgi:S1-C subfamily serine protease